jgi:hypothetical protein
LALGKGQRPSSEDQAEALLFAALREALGSVSDSRGGDMDAATISDTLTRAGKEFLDLMVASGLQSLGVPDSMIDLEERKSRSLRRALLLEHDRMSVSRALTSMGVDHLFFKGALSDPIWWGGRGMRGASDLDVLVTPSAEEESILALKGLGYRRVRTSTHLATEDASKERLFYHADLRSHFPVDLHLGLLNSPPYRDPTDQVFQRAFIYEAATGTIRGPSREDLLLLAAGNLGQSCFPERYKLAVDTACLLTREKLNLEMVLDRAAQWHVSMPLWGLLRLVQERLNIPLPERFLDEIAPVHLLRRIIERVAGVRSSPWHPGRGIKHVLASWPLSGRTFWPIIATWQWACLRLADHARSRQSQKSLPL